MDALGVVTAAIAPLYAVPDLRSELVSQALLGQLLTVREERGTFLRVRTEDGYPGWIHQGYVLRSADAVVSAWRQEATLASLGATLSLSGRERMLVPLGARLAPAPNSAVKLPDGRVAQVATGRVAPVVQLRDEARVMSPSSWAEIFFAGAPYLYGGMTPWGVDCSGLVQVTYLMRGVTLPRDSTMQVEAGEPIEAGDALAPFTAGDLLFFSESPGKVPAADAAAAGAARRITHVAMSDGEGGVVHAALAAGGVVRSPLSGNSPEAIALRNSFVKARRPEGG